VGLFVGAWGVADALARLFGTLLSGVVRDGMLWATGSKATGYVSVFVLEALAVVVSLLLLPRIDVNRFRDRATGTRDIIALAGETSQ
jgi:BCD family chlorophyll transporter-like MFS transporter